MTTDSSCAGTSAAAACVVLAVAIASATPRAHSLSFPSSRPSLVATTAAAAPSSRRRRCGGGGTSPPSSSSSRCGANVGPFLPPLRSSLTEEASGGGGGGGSGGIENETSFGQRREEGKGVKSGGSSNGSGGSYSSESPTRTGHGASTPTPREQFQEVLSSPDLLDPASILDATIGSFLPNEEDDSFDSEGGSAEGGEISVPTGLIGGIEDVAFDDARADAPADLASNDGEAFDFPANPAAGDDVDEIPKSKASSKEEDLELTLRAIMDHMDQLSVGNTGVLDDEQGDEEADERVGTIAKERNENSQQQLDLTTQSTSQAISTPSVRKILRYTIPAIGIWLCSPVLSMIDTAAVGLLSGTAQQAALNPAVSVTDYGALVVAFMYTATTNLIAAAVQEDKDDTKSNAQTKTRTTLITALKLALLVGSAFGVILFSAGRTLLRLLIGNDALDPTVFSAALRYVRIRSLGMPAMVVIGTAQSACLGMQDVTSPLYVLLAAAVVNFFGDVLLVPRAGSAAFGGAAGAAWATVASQYAALLFFAGWLTSNADAGERKEKEGRGGGRGNGLAAFCRRLCGGGNRASEVDSLDAGNDGNVVDVTQGIMELTGTSKEGRSRRKEFNRFLASSKLLKRIRRAGGSGGSASSLTPSPVTPTTASKKDAILQEQHIQRKQQPRTRGFLANGTLTLRNYFSFSKDNFDRSKAKEFSPFVVPVTTTSIGRISGYIAMSHVASSTLGTFDMAGHQIVFSIFCCLTPFVDALSQVAQSFVPAVVEAKGSPKERASALRDTTDNFRKVGVGFGAVLLSLVACIPWIGGFFTTDPIVLERVKSAIPGLGLFLFVHGLVCQGEGTLLGQKDLGFLRNMYAIFFFTVPAYMLRLKHRALTGVQAVSIGTMWAAFSTYNVIRGAVWHLRLAQLQRRKERETISS